LNLKLSGAIQLIKSQKTKTLKKKKISIENFPIEKIQNYQKLKNSLETRVYLINLKIKESHKNK